MQPLKSKLKMQSFNKINTNHRLTYKDAFFDPLISNITLQILFSHWHTLLIAETGDFLSLPTKVMMGDHILYSHDFSDRERVNLTTRNLTLITKY